METYILGRFPTAFRIRFRPLRRTLGALSSWVSPSRPHFITSAQQCTPHKKMQPPPCIFAQATPSAFGTSILLFPPGLFLLTFPSSAQSHPWEACLHLPSRARRPAPVLCPQDSVWHLFPTPSTKTWLKESS